MGFVCRIRVRNGSLVVSPHADADEAIAFAVRWLRSEEVEPGSKYSSDLIEVADDRSKEVVWRWRGEVVEDFREQPIEPHG